MDDGVGKDLATSSLTGAGRGITKAGTNAVRTVVGHPVHVAGVASKAGKGVRALMFAGAITELPVAIADTYTYIWVQKSVADVIMKNKNQYDDNELDRASSVISNSTAGVASGAVGAAGSVLMSYAAVAAGMVENAAALSELGPIGLLVGGGVGLVVGLLSMPPPAPTTRPPQPISYYQSRITDMVGDYDAGTDTYTPGKYSVVATHHTRGMGVSWYSHEYTNQETGQTYTDDNLPEMSELEDLRSLLRTAQKWEDEHPAHDLTPEEAGTLQRQAWDQAIYNLTIDPDTNQMYPRDQTSHIDLNAEVQQANQRLARDYFEANATGVPPHLSNSEWAAWLGNQEGAAFYTTLPSTGESQYMQMAQGETLNMWADTQMDQAAQRVFNQAAHDMNLNPDWGNTLISPEDHAELMQRMTEATNNYFTDAELQEQYESDVAALGLTTVDFNSSAVVDERYDHALDNVRGLLRQPGWNLMNLTPGQKALLRDRLAAGNSYTSTDNEIDHFYAQAMHDLTGGDDTDRSLLYTGYRVSM